MDNIRNLAFCNYVVWKETQWFWSINFNALFSRNIVSGEVKRWGNYIKFREKGNGAAYNNVVLYHNKIIAVPGRERKILIWDMETESFRYIDLNMQFIGEEENAFFAYVVSGRQLFMIGNEIPYLLKFDMESEAVLQVVNLNVSMTGRKVCFRDAALDKDKLLIPLIDENMVFEVDKDTLQWTKRKVGNSNDGFSVICRGADSIWLVPRQQGAVLQWYREKDRIIAHEIEKEGFRYLSTRNNFHSAHVVGDRIWVFPFQGSMVFSFDAETGELRKENAVNRYIKRLPSGDCVFRAVQVEQEQIFLLCYCMDEWVQMIYAPERDELETLSLKCEISNEEYLRYLYKAGIRSIGEKEMPLEHFVEFLISYDRKEEDRFPLAECNNGYQIWKTIH